MSVRISAVIPAWKASSTLADCLGSLTRQNAFLLEIIVVDDDSPDDTASMAEALCARVVRLPCNMGPARARNEGVAAASGDVILFVDSDVTIPEGLVEAIQARFEDPAVSAVQTLYTPSCPASGLVSRYQNFYYHHALARVGEESTAIFATWCAAVRKDLFERLGGFNTDIPEPTVEDEEFGYAIADSGGRIILDKSLQVVHMAAYDLRGFARRRMRMARAQAKSGLRQVRDRLFARYINVHETGTHHSRLVVASILLMPLSLASAIASLPFGPAMFGLSALLFASAMLCHLDFFCKASRQFGPGILPGFALMCAADMLILAWGILRGTASFVLGRRY